MNDTVSVRKPKRWRVLGRVLLFFIGCAVLLAVSSALTPKLPGSWPLVVVGLTASLGALALTFLFVRWDGLCLRDVGSSPNRWSLWRFAVGLLFGLFLVALSASIQTVTGHLQWVRTPGVGFGLGMVTLLGFVALACREELGFRGYPLFQLERTFGLWGAQSIVALVFALEHWLGGWPLARAVLGAGIGGLVFGMAALATRGLALPIGMHAAFNFGDSMIGQNYAPGLWKVVIESGQEGHVQHLISISYLIVMGLALFGFWLWHRQVSRIRCRA